MRKPIPATLWAMLAVCLLVSCNGYDDDSAANYGGNGGSTPTPQDSTPAPNSYNFTALDAYLDQNLAAFENNVVVLLYQGDSLIYQREEGFTKNTFLAVASATKLASACLLLNLVDEGLLDMEATTGQYLPYANSVQNGGNRTLRQLFSLTSGFKEYPAFLDTVLANNFLTQDQVAQIVIEDQPYFFAAGQGVYYGGRAMMVAARMAEVATGTDWKNLFAQRLANPLGWTRTTYGARPAARVGGGLVSTPAEYINLLRMIKDGGTFNGQQILQPQTIDSYLFNDQTNGQPIVQSPYPHNPPYHPYNVDTVRYAFGCWTDVINPTTNTVEQISSPGAFGTYPWVDRPRDLAGIIFTNVRLPLVENIELRMIDLIRQAVDAGPDN